MTEAQFFEHRLKIAECEEQLKTVSGCRRNGVARCKNADVLELQRCNDVLEVRLDAAI